MNTTHKLFCTLTAGALALSAFAARIETSYDHANGWYYPEHKATFTVKITDDAGKPLTSGTVTALLDNYGTKIITPAQEYDLAKANPFKIAGTLGKPGYLRLRVKSANVAGLPSNMADGWYADTVECMANRLYPNEPMPQDFAGFWKAAIAKYDREMPNARPVLKLDEKLCDATWNVWRLTLDVPNNRKLHAFVTKEKKAPAGKMPARVQISAAGFGTWSQSPLKVPGHISLFVTVYPFEPDPGLSRKADYQALDAYAQKEWGVPRYCHIGIAKSREDCFFYPVILGALRMIDWLADREDVDRMHLTYSGTSQGGGLGLAVTALTPKIRRAAIFVPALTGHYGYKVGLESGWPKFVETEKDPARRAIVEKNAAYFDGINFARLIHQPIRIVAGHVDPTCPPCMVRMAANASQSFDGGFEAGKHMTHGVFGDLYRKYERWLDQIPETQALWPEGKTPEFKDYQTTPEIEWFAPTARVTKTCIIIAPGGGYTGCAVAHEGYRTAQNFLSLGLHAVVLRYRVPSTGPLNNRDFWHSAAWQDAQRAVRLVRSQAKARGIDPEKIGMTGFSAGGHLTCYTALCSQTPAYKPVDELDKVPCHLNFAVPVYPAYLLQYKTVRLPHRGDEMDCPLIDQFAFDAKTPPMCFIHGDDDGHSAMGSVYLYSKLRKMKIHSDLHVYSGVNHGFGGSVRGGWRPCGWEIQVYNFLGNVGLAPRRNYITWPDEKK